VAKKRLPSAQYQLTRDSIEADLEKLRVKTDVDGEPTVEPSRETKLRAAVKAAIVALSANQGPELTSHTMRGLEILGAVIGAEVRKDRPELGTKAVLRSYLETLEDHMEMQRYAQAFTTACAALPILIRRSFPTAVSADISAETQYPVFERGLYVTAIRDADGTALWERDSERGYRDMFIWYLGRFGRGLKYGPDGWFDDVIDAEAPLTYRQAFVFPPTPNATVVAKGTK
jgi:hypothetical protein